MFFQNTTALINAMQGGRAMAEVRGATLAGSASASSKECRAAPSEPRRGSSRSGQSTKTLKGVVHAFANPFGATAQAVIALSPDIGAQYFRDIAAVVDAGGPSEEAALVAVMSRCGLVPAAPK